MARRAGRSAKVYIDTSVGANGSAVPTNYLSSLKIGNTADQIETTSFGDATKTYVAGMLDASGSFDGFVDMGTATFSSLADGNARKLYIYPDATNHATLYGFCTANFSADYDTSVSDAIKVSLSWSAATSWTTGPAGLF